MVVLSCSARYTGLSHAIYYIVFNQSVLLQRTKPSDLPRLGDRQPRCLLVLPSDALTNPVPQYFGFAVTEEFLADMARAEFPRRVKAGADGVELTRLGLRLLCARSGTRDLFLAAGRHDGKYSPPPFIGPGGIVPLVAVCSTSISSYRRRPSQAQIDRVAKIAGVQPRWWKAFASELPNLPEKNVIASVLV